MGFDKAGVRRVFLQKIHRRIEAFDMADRKHHLVFPRLPDHRRRLFDRSGQRFLNQDMLAHLQQWNRALIVFRRRDRDTQRFALLRQFQRIGEYLQSKLFTNPVGGFRRKVVNAHYIGIFTQII